MLWWHWVLIALAVVLLIAILVGGLDPTAALDDFSDYDGDGGTD